jgi:hypothetical protein
MKVREFVDFSQSDKRGTRGKRQGKWLEWSGSRFSPATPYHLLPNYELRITNYSMHPKSFTVRKVNNICLMT